MKHIPVTNRMYVHRKQLVLSKHGQERIALRGVRIPDGSWEIVEHSMSYAKKPTTVLRRQHWDGTATIIVVGIEPAGKLKLVTAWTDDGHSSLASTNAI